MKKIIPFTLLALALMLSNLVSAHAVAEINWMSVDEMQEAQKNESRKVMIDVYTKWCGPCKMMMSNTFTNPDVIEYINENFYAVKLNAEGADDLTFKGKVYSNPDYNPEAKGRNGVHEFSRFLGVRAYPTLVYMDENLNLLQAIPGYQKPQQLELYLKLFAEDRYVDMDQDGFNVYKENFQNEFKQ